MEDQEYKIKRREQNVSFWKFVLGTFILGLTANAINLYVQKSKIAFDIRKEETRGLQSFLDRYTSIEKAEKKLDFLKFMSTISQSPEVRARYDTLHKFVRLQIESKKESNKKIDDISEKIPDKVAEINRLEKVIITGEPDNQTTVEDAKAKMDELLQEKEVLEAIEQTGKINQSENKISPFDNTKISDSEAQAIILSEIDQWLKEGYFRTYNDYILGINDLNVNENEVQFQLRRSKTFNTDVVRNFELKIGEQEIINTDNSVIIITLKDIGRAGKNPFKKAAIYNVKVLKHKS